MMDDSVRVEIEHGVAWVRFNRPEQMNAFSPEVAAGFVAAIEQVERDVLQLGLGGRSPAPWLSASVGLVARRHRR